MKRPIQTVIPSLLGLAILGSLTFAAEAAPKFGDAAPDFSLAGSRLAVTKLYGTADGVAPAKTVLANAALLPSSTHWVAIEGGNHHQFGYYGFQPGDRWASISRAQQQEQTLRALLDALQAVHDAIQPPHDADTAAAAAVGTLTGRPTGR